ncbi:MAG TPA: ferrochelatase [Devosia sp.]|nr:ferrochelatase [Devosia sp.]
MNTPSPQISNPGTAKTGVLLLNLGTPDATDYWSMRRYLKEFLSDRRVIETPRWLWWPLLNLIVLTTRPKKSGAAYDKIWDRKADDSPLRIISASQAKKLQQRLGKSVVVDFAMRYGNPSTQEGIMRLKEAGCEKILLLPLYPQYSAATTATANDKAFDVLRTMRWQPAIRTAPPYFAHHAYLGALADGVEKALGRLEFEPQRIITSYHGMPQAYVDKGDPYFDQCKKTTSLLARQLGWPEERLILAFQSRFGPEEWLKPYTDEVLAALPSEGIKNIAIMAPAFSVDCLETLEELAMEGKKIFLNAGGENFAYIGCLNDTEPGMDAIEAVARDELGGWL